MRRIVAAACVIMAGCAYGISSWAVMPPPRSPYEAPRTIPAQINGFRYIAGLKEVDENGFARYDRPKVWAELRKKEFALSRQRLEQETFDRKARKLEKVDLVKIPYKKIIEVWFGDEAIRKLAVTNLPRISRNMWNFRTNSYTPVEVFVDQQRRAPVVVIYKKGRKKRGALIVMGSTEKSYALYALLKQASISE